MLGAHPAYKKAAESMEGILLLFILSFISLIVSIINFVRWRVSRDTGIKGKNAAFSFLLIAAVLLIIAYALLIQFGAGMSL